MSCVHVCLLDRNWTTANFDPVPRHLLKKDLRSCVQKFGTKMAVDVQGTLQDQRCFKNDC